MKVGMGPALLLAVRDKQPNEKEKTMKPQYTPDDSFVSSLYNQALNTAAQKPEVHDTQFIAKKVAAKALRPVREQQVRQLKAQLAALETELSKWQ